jgi:uncharacterized protein (TIGR00296 family)
MVNEEINLEDGKILIKFARENIETYLKTSRPAVIPENIEKKYSNKFGVFVTLNKIEGNEKRLRGCIGYPEPIFPLIKAIHNASISSATEDPRFSSVSIDEMDKIVIELTVLTPPKLIEVNDPNEYLEKIKIGRDGLIVEHGIRRGLLLPQVPVDDGRNWDVKTFLEHTCMKAWLPTDSWKNKETKIYKFEGKIFEEVKPHGEIVTKEI